MLHGGDGAQAGANNCKPSKTELEAERARVSRLWFHVGGEVATTLLSCTRLSDTSCGTTFGGNTNSKQLMPKKNAEFYKKNYGVSKWIFVKFIIKVLQRWKNYENSKVLPSIHCSERSQWVDEFIGDVRHPTIDHTRGFRSDGAHGVDLYVDSAVTRVSCAIQLEIELENPEYVRFLEPFFLQRNTRRHRRTSTSC